MKLLKWIVIGLVAIVVAVVVAGYAVLSTLDIEQYRGVIEAKAEEATGRKLTVAGPMDLAVSWTPAVSVEDVSFANADWGSRPEMVTMKRFELEVAVLPLLSGEVQVNRVVLVEPDILLETNGEGAGNWTLALEEAGGTAPAPSGEGEGEALVKLQSIGGVRIENGKLTYRDGATGEETRVTLDALSLAAASMSSPVEVALDGTYNDNPIKLKGTS